MSFGLLFLVACAGGPVESDVAATDTASDTEPVGRPPPPLVVGTWPVAVVAETVVAEGEVGGQLGSTVAVGDLDGDGFVDLVAGARGASPGGVVYVAPGPIRGSTWLAPSLTAKVTSVASGGFVGSGVWLGDVDADGGADLLVSAPGLQVNSGRVAKFGSVTSAVDFGVDADWEVTGNAEDRLGTDLSIVPDVDGDAVADLLVGAPGCGIGCSSGVAWLVLGPVLTSVALDESTAQIFGELGDAVGTSVSGLGDVDGDGIGEIAVGAPGDTVYDVDSGSVGVFFGPILGAPRLDVAGARFVGGASGEQVGVGLAGPTDGDGDGHADLLFGAPGVVTGGAVYLATAPFSGIVFAPTATFRVLPVAVDEGLGAVLTSVDLDADGATDVIVGLPKGDVVGGDDGAVAVLFGPLQGVRAWNTADLLLTGSTAADEVGLAVLAADLDGDALPELVVGASLGGSELGTGALFAVPGGVR